MFGGTDPAARPRYPGGVVRASFSRSGYERNMKTLDSRVPGFSRVGAALLPANGTVFALSRDSMGGEWRRGLDRLVSGHLVPSLLLSGTV
jgi:hypothetical protein